MFYQLFTIHADVGSTSEYVNVIPILYARLPDKSYETYNLLFKMIKTEQPEWEPEIASMDFEIAAISAIRCINPNIKIVGCQFHFVQCLWRR